MTSTLMQFCETCKTDTRRCEYYPPGRSRQHAVCLDCALKNNKDPRPYVSKDPRYCAECDRDHQAQRLEGRK